MKRTIKLRESELKRMITESVKGLINELDWKTYMNAAKKRSAQADEIRDMYKDMGFMPPYDTSFDKKSDELEKYAQEVFQKKYGKDGHSHQYDGPYTSYMGRRTFDDSDSNAEIKAPTRRIKYYDGSFEDVRNYRYGQGTPYKHGGKITDDTFDQYEGSDEDGPYDRKVERYYTERIGKNGSKYEPELSSVGNEVSMSKDDDYNKALDNMRNDMVGYYTGKSKYINGKGWENESINKKIGKIVSESIRKMLI